MARLVIDGGYPVEGEMRVHGAKNAVLPILAATVLNGGRNVIHDCPNIRDVVSTIAILEFLGCKIHRENNTLTVDSSDIKNEEIPEQLMLEMRSSVIFLGALISRFGKTRTTKPGGCELGARPIDLHLKALRQLGVKVTEEHGSYLCSAEKLAGTQIHLGFPSVGATENIMLAAVKAEGTTVITNAAKEPEIVDLQNYLNGMGARIIGAGTDIIRIDGVQRLGDVEHTVMPDRIVAATYLACSAITGGIVELINADKSHMEATLAVMRDCGSRIYISGDKIIHIPPKRIKAATNVRTQPYPGFPTDAQSTLLALLTLAEGTSIFFENIFENRFNQTVELVRMGADITVDGRMAVIRGVERLSGASVTAMDLRGGAALVVAALAAEGRTVIDNVCYIDRGYESIETVLAAVGARIHRD